MAGRLLSRLFLAILFVLFGLKSAVPADDRVMKKSCKEHPKLSGPCFNVRGRLSFYNGNPSMRIWPVGTNRLLGVSEGRFNLPEYANMPPEIIEKLGGFDNKLFADFTVCPFENDKPGVMRLICVESAKNIFVRPRERQ